MTLRVAINGFGRIGRNFMRCWLSRGLDTGIEVVGLNDTSDPRTNSHLLQYDTMLGHIRNAEVSYTDDTIVVNGKHIKCFTMRCTNMKAIFGHCIPYKGTGEVCR